jgi:hypothetical protein
MSINGIFSIVAEFENTCSSIDKALLIKWVRYNQGIQENLQMEKVTWVLVVLTSIGL